MKTIKSLISKLIGRGPVAVVLSVVVSVLFITGLVSAATTISTNISTGGTLSVVGQSTLGGQASTTRLSVNETAYFGGTATTTINSTGALTMSGGTGTSNALATIGTVVTSTGVDVSANVGRLSGLQINLNNTAATVTGFRGIDSRVTDAGGTADNVVALQGVATKSSGVSTGELWGTNSIVSMTGGSVVNAYGVVGDLTIGTGAIISADQLNSYATAGYFNSFIHSGATLTKIIDSAIIGQISSDTGRGKSPKGTFGITSILNGALNQSTAGASAAYKVLDFNTDANFDYGLDLFYSDSPYSNVFATADIRLQNGETISNATDGTIAFSGLTRRTVTTGITAGTTQTQAGATALTTDINNVATVAVTNDGVKLPAGVVGQDIVVINRGANTLLLYPASGGTINALAADAGYAVATLVEARCTFITATSIECQKLSR